MSQTLKTEVTEKDYQTFLDISVILTGFGKNELLATGMHETYYYTIMKEPDQDNVRAFFKKAQEIMDTHSHDELLLKKQVAEDLVPDKKYIELAKRIILVWYTGIWTVITLRAEPYMISSESYTEGLIWKVAETHPAGAKQPGFGSWEFPPLT